MEGDVQSFCEICKLFFNFSVTCSTLSHTNILFVPNLVCWALVTQRSVFACFYFFTVLHSKLFRLNCIQEGFLESSSMTGVSHIWRCSGRRNVYIIDIQSHLTISAAAACEEGGGGGGCPSAPFRFRMRTETIKKKTFTFAGCKADWTEDSKVSSINSGDHAGLWMNHKALQISVN